MKKKTKIVFLLNIEIKQNYSKIHTKLTFQVLKESQTHRIQIHLIRSGMRLILRKTYLIVISLSNIKVLF